MDGSPLIPTLQQRVDCDLVSLTALNTDVYRVVLRQSRSSYVPYLPGQYLQIVLENGEQVPFSIASAPNHQSMELELHIQIGEKRSRANAAIDLIKRRQAAMVEMPLGEACWLQPPSAPLLFLAGGTGFAQTKALLESLFQHKRQQQVFLYWRGKNWQSFYLLDLIANWLQDYPYFHFRQVVDGDPVDPDALYRAVRQDKVPLSMVEGVFSGAPAMVLAWREALCGCGLRPDSVLSDGFAAGLTKQTQAV